jgi:putative FmdB family regulatory protein
MPIYEYRCEACGRRFEKLQKLSDPPCKKCPTCGGALRKVICSPAIQFKGTGFYITDYAKKSAPEPERKGDSAGEAKSGGKADEKRAEAKPKAEPTPPDKPCD